MRKSCKIGQMQARALNLAIIGFLRCLLRVTTSYFRIPGRDAFNLEEEPLFMLLTVVQVFLYEAFHVNKKIIDVPTDFLVVPVPPADF